MDASQERSPRSGEKEKEDVSIEDRPPSQTSLLALPETGTPERILAERKLVRKLDTRVLPTIFFIFIMNYIDVGSSFIVTYMESADEEFHSVMASLPHD